MRGGMVERWNGGVVEWWNARRRSKERVQSMQRKESHTEWRQSDYRARNFRIQLDPFALNLILKLKLKLILSLILDLILNLILSHPSRLVIEKQKTARTFHNR